MLQQSTLTPAQAQVLQNELQTVIEAASDLKLVITYTCAPVHALTAGLSDNLTAIVDVWRDEQLRAINAQLAQLTSTDVLA